MNMILDDRTKSLIAVGASVTANCQPCLELHIGKSRENGADEQQIKMAIEVAKSVRKGSEAKMEQFIATVINTTTDA
jgi:AhpD family alkylhydroperoxidase